MALKMTIAFSDNPRLDPLKDGTVRPDNIDLEFVTTDTNTLFHRILARGLEFDASEISISDSLLAKERNDSIGGGKWDWSLIPVFMSRSYHTGSIYVNASSGIESLADFRGKRIGVSDYVMTGALWLRVTLKELYGIEAWDNIWYNCRTKELSHGGALGFHLPGNGVGNGVTHHWLTPDQTMDVMLDQGELDAIFAPKMAKGITAGDPTVIDRYGGTPMTGNPRIRKLFNDRGKAVISEFFRRTGYYHVNHHMAIKNSILREHPWVAMELYRAFQRSKEVAYQRATRAQSVYLYFEGNDWKEQAALFGEDPYPLGLRAMRKNIERAIQGSVEQGMLRKPIRIEDLYFHTTLDT